MEEEIWKFVKETNSRRFGKRIYEVSNTGKARCNGVILPLYNFRKTKYYADPTRTELLLHRLIAKLFIPNPENKPCIDHLNGNKHDNRISNLRWCTYSENMQNPITREHNSQSLKRLYSNKENHPMYGKKHTSEHTKNQSAAQLGRTPWNKGKSGVQTAWNKGKTKEINQSLKQLGERVSITMKQKIATGEIVICNKGKKYMNNGMVGCWVTQEEINKYIENGYTIGYLKHDKL